MNSKRGKGRRPSHYGMIDYFRFYNRTHSYKVDKKTYSAVVSEMNKFIRDYIVEYALDVKFPARMGVLGIRKEKREPKIIKGKVINNAPPDWAKTLNLWRNDEEAHIKKIIIKHNNSHTDGYVYRAYYKKGSATYKNKTVYYFNTSRTFKRNINKRILDYTKDKYDSILLYKRK